MQRCSWRTLAVILIIVSSFMGIAGCGNNNPSIESISLPMGYVANVQFSPFYMAKERTYFEDAGFDVTFDYRWETDGIQLTAAGEIPFTVASGDQVIQARSQGLPVIAVASWYQKFPVAVISLEDLPLDEPSDLEGLTIGIPETFGASYIGLRALLEAGGLTESDIDLQAIGYTQLAALTNETLDATVVYANNEPVVLAQEGTSYNALYVSDYADLVSAALISSDTYVEEHPERVRAFVAAFLKGLEDVLADPDEAFEISKNYIEGLEENADVQRGVLDASIELWRTPNPGRFDPQAWEKAQSVMAKAGMIEQTVPVDELYTNAYLPKSD